MIARIWAAMLKAATLDRWALFGAAVVITILFVGGGALIYLGAWGPALAEKRLDYIGTGFLMMGGGLLMVLASLTAVSFRFKAPGGVEAEFGRELPPPGPTVVATADQRGNVTVSATPAPPAPGPPPAAASPTPKVPDDD